MIVLVPAPGKSHPVAMRPSVRVRGGGLAVGLPVLSSILFMWAAAGAQPARPPLAGSQMDAGNDAPANTPPPPPVVNDPLLTAVPPAPNVLTTWRDALKLITSRSIDVAVALQEIQRAEGLARQALALALPTINATGSITGQILWAPNFANPLGGATSNTGTNPVVMGQLMASQPLFAPRAWYGIKTANMAVTSAKLTAEDKKRVVFAGVANAIVAVFTAERVAELNRAGLRTALERLDLTRRMFRLGSGTRLDVLRVEQDTATARATLVTGDESLRQAREALGLALGFQAPYGVPSSISLNDVEQTVHEICAPTPLDQRADIRKAHNDIEVAKRGITDAWLSFAPTVTLSTTASVSNQVFAASSGGNGQWSIQGLLSIPLWEGGARYGALRIARVAAEESKLTLEATMRSATITVTQAMRSVAVAEQARTVSANGRDLAKELAHLTQRSYQMGTETSLNLVITAQQARAAELDVAVKEFQVINAKIAALLATSDCTY